MVYFQSADGRAFTDYRSPCIRNNELKKKYNLKNEHEYRQFIQKNGLKLIQEEQKKALQESNNNIH